MPKDVLVEVEVSRRPKRTKEEVEGGGREKGERADRVWLCLGWRTVRCCYQRLNQMQTLDGRRTIRSRFKNRFRFQRVGRWKEKVREEKGRRRRVELVSLGARLESHLASEKRPAT